MWEPTTSRLVLDKLARKIATGASVNENDGGFMVMPKALMTSVLTSSMAGWRPSWMRSCSSPTRRMPWP